LSGLLANLIHLEALDVPRGRAVLFFTTFFLTSLATYMTIVFIPLYALSLTQSLPLISLLTTSYYLAFTASLPIYGWASDRLGSYAAFTMLGAALTGALCIAIPFTKGVGELMALRAAQGLAWALVAPMGAAMASMSTTKDLRGRAVSVFNLSTSSGYLAGSLIGGLASELLGLTATFMLGGAASLTAALLSLGLRGWRTVERGRVKQHLKLGGLKAVYIGFFLRNAGATGIWALLPVYLASLGASRLWIGLLYAVNLASQTALMGYVGHLADKLGRKPTLLLGLFGSSAVFTLYGLAPHYLWIAPIHVLLGLSWCSLINASTAHIGDRAPMEAQGYTMSLLFTITGLAWIAGSSLAAATVDLLGLRNYMFLAASLASLGGLYVAKFMEAAERT
jgi:MFS family permease